MRSPFFRRRLPRHTDSDEQRVPRVLTVRDEGSVEAAARLAGFVVAGVPTAVGAVQLLRLQRADVLVVQVDDADPEQMAALVDCARRDYPAMRVWVQTDDAALGAHLMLLGAERHFDAREALVPLFEAAMEVFLERGMRVRTGPRAWAAWP